MKGNILPPKKLNFWGERILNNKIIYDTKITTHTNNKIIYDTKITTHTNNKMWLQHASLLQNVGVVH
jgi:hypothetical protein